MNDLVHNNFIIQTKNLGKIYSSGELNVEVLKDVNLNIDSGEFISIMGPSGSGKSTLLYLLGGLDRPTSGTIHVMGKNLADMADGEASVMRRREIGFVFQFYNLIPNLNVEENILLPVLLDGKRIDSYRDALEDILEIVELADRRKHTPRELSGGQQQRVAIARALINEPEIIYADEPTGNLDSHSGEEVMNLIQKINSERRKTIVMVTHSKEAASYAAREIHVLDGRIVE